MLKAKKKMGYFCDECNQFDRYDRLRSHYVNKHQSRKAPEQRWVCMVSASYEFTGIGESVKKEDAELKAATKFIQLLVDIGKLNANVILGDGQDGGTATSAVTSNMSMEAVHSVRPIYLLKYDSR